jgi:hypothetical protein
VAGGSVICFRDVIKDSRIEDRADRHRVTVSAVVGFGVDGVVLFGDRWGGVRVVGHGMMVTISH